MNTNIQVVLFVLVVVLLVCLASSRSREFESRSLHKHLQLTSQKDTRIRVGLQSCYDLMFKCIQITKELLFSTMN